MTQHFTRVALAGAMTLATSFPGLALAQDKKPVVMVMQDAENSPRGSVAHRTRHLIINRLTDRGYVVLDGASSHKPLTSQGRIELRLRTNSRRLTGTYTTRAFVGLTATLRDGVSKRNLGRIETPAGTPRRIATNCAQACQDRIFFDQARRLASDLVARIDRRLARLATERAAAAKRTAPHSVTFRGIKPGHLPQIEQYLSFFPGVSKVRRDRTTGESVLYRYRQSGPTHRTEISLKKMLHHLQLNARLQRVGDSFVITVTPAARPVVHPRDW